MVIGNARRSMFVTMNACDAFAWTSLDQLGQESDPR